MRFYTKPHRYYCGIDLHARRMYLCVLDREGKILVHRNGPATAGALSQDDRALPRGPRGGGGMHLHLVLSGRSVRPGGIAFVLGHALYMRRISRRDDFLS